MKYEVTLWIGFIRLRIVFSGGACEYGSEYGSKQLPTSQDTPCVNYGGKKALLYKDTT